MPFSFHSHSGEFCQHASGDLEEMILAAIKKKYKLFALTEHCPRFHSVHLYPEEIEKQMMPPDLFNQFHSFVQKARLLREKYKNEITLLIGVETEWLPVKRGIDTGLECLNLKQIYQLDLIVGSLHHIQDIPIDFSKELSLKAAEVVHGKYSDSSCQIDSLFTAYYDAQYEMLKQLKPDIIGHFDLIKKYFPDLPLTPKHWKLIKRNLTFIIEQLPLSLIEINCKGFNYNPELFPSVEILKLIKKKGGKLTLSDDCHSPDQVGAHYDKLMKVFELAGIEELFYYTLKKADPEQIIYEPQLKLNRFPITQFEKWLHSTK